MTLNPLEMTWAFTLLVGGPTAHLNVVPPGLLDQCWRCGRLGRSEKSGGEVLLQEVE